jgi:hypothetical protein
MKRIFLVLFLISLSSSKAQIHEVGVFLGGSNFIGDVGSTTYVNPNEFAYGLLYKWNKSPRHSWRASYVQSKLTSRDADSDMKSRKERDYSFENSVKELSLGLEFNFLDFNQHDMTKKITPYIYSGVSYTRYDGLYFAGENYPKTEKKYGALAIPMTIGVKAKVLDHWVIGIEAGARYTFKDDIDGSNPTSDKLSHLKFGNINSTDWYVFSGMTLTYTFGNKPCYCKL